MNEALEKLACRIGEGFQMKSPSQQGRLLNVFHRPVSVFDSFDLSFINGFVLSGLRGTAFLSGEKMVGNYNQLFTAVRQHLPIVVNIQLGPFGMKDYSSFNHYHPVNAIRDISCFKFIASSAQQHADLLIIAHRIAELSLMPCCIFSDYRVNPTSEVRLPDDDLIIKYLGSPDEQVESPTPAQEMIFGKTRRRIPNWFNYDAPVALGMKKNTQDISFESAALQTYFLAHLPELVEQAFFEMKTLSDITIDPVSCTGKSSDYAVVFSGLPVKDLFEEITGKSKNVELIQINQIDPFPNSKIREKLINKKAITILDQDLSPGPEDSILIASLKKCLKDCSVRIYTGKCRPDLDVESLDAAVQNMLSKSGKPFYFLGIPFTKDHSNFPRHQILLQEIERKYPHLSDQSLLPVNTTELSIPKSHEIAAALRSYRDQGPNYSRLTRFYNDTGLFYQNDRMNELVADPFAALPLTPVATAGFLDQSNERTFVPVFAAEKCTGCGDCFVECPHSALPPIAIGVDQLLKTGSEIVTAKKMTVSRITPLIKNIAKAANQDIRGKKIGKLRDFLPMAFDKVSRQMKMDEDKLEVAHSEFSDIMDELEDFQVAVTEPFFNSPESIEAGTGELFSLSVDPSACTGCGVCVQTCEEQALTMVNQDAAHLSLLKKRFHIWEQLPDTPGGTIKRLQHEKGYPSLSAALMSRSYYLSMIGANQLEPASNSKTLIHLITSITESVVQPKILDQLQKIDALIDALSKNLHHKLSNALPKENLENLSESLHKSRRRKIHLHDLLDQIDEHLQGKFIDSEDLERKSILIKDLKNLRWILSEGPSGAGRSRFGLLMAGSESSNWMHQYPYNNFTSPVIIHWDGGTSAQAISLFNGQLRYQLDHIKLMRRADLESRDKYNPSEHDLAIAELAWDDLTDAEKSSVSPLLLMVDHQYVSEYGWGHLNQLLAERYPIKVFILDNLITHQKMPIADLSNVQAGMLTALAMKNVFVFQGSVGKRDHLFEGLMDGIHGLFPALFRIHTTEFSKHTDSSIGAAIYTNIATDCRVFPLMKYHPADKREFLRGAIKLNGNSAMNDDWVEEQILLDSDQSIKYPLSWADWAYTQNGWQSHFTPLPEGASWIVVPHYIALDLEARKNTTPVILRANKQGMQYIEVSDEIIKVSEAVKDHWRTLQELAGVLYEFPVKLKKEVEKELTLGFEKQIEQIKNDFDRKLKNEQAQQMQRMKTQLKEKLLSLSQMAKDKIKP